MRGLLFGLVVAAALGKPSVFPEPNICTISSSNTTSLLGSTSWQSDDCPAQALCVPSHHDHHRVCSCKYNEYLLVHVTTVYGNTKCGASVWTYLYGGVWVVVALCSFAIALWCGWACLACKRLNLLKMDTLGAISILVVVNAAIFGVMRLIVAVDILALPEGKDKKRLVTVLTVISAASIFALIVLALMFGATISLSLPSARLVTSDVTRKQTRQAHVVVVLVSALGFSILFPLWYGEYAIACVWIASFALITTLMYGVLIEQLRKQASQQQQRTPGEDMARKLVEKFRLVSHKTICCCFVFVLSSCLYAVCWFVGRRDKNRVLLGPVTAVVLVVYFGVILYFLFIFARLVTERLNNRVTNSFRSPRESALTITSTANNTTTDNTLTNSQLAVFELTCSPRSEVDPSSTPTKEEHIRHTKLLSEVSFRSTVPANHAKSDTVIFRHTTDNNELGEHNQRPSAWRQTTS